jgi:predicted nucleic acid-binding protein
MTAKILVDTDIIVDFLRGHPAATEFIENNAGRMALSAITVAELFCGSRDDGEAAELDSFTQVFPTLSVTGEIARLGGLIKKQFGPSHGVGLADAIIAATATNHCLRLETCNVRHFPMFDGLAAPYRK